MVNWGGGGGGGGGSGGGGSGGGGSGSGGSGSGGGQYGSGSHFAGQTYSGGSFSPAGSTPAPSPITTPAVTAPTTLPRTSTGAIDFRSSGWNYATGGQGPMVGTGQAIPGALTVAGAYESSIRPRYDATYEHAANLGGITLPGITTRTGTFATGTGLSAYARERLAAEEVHTATQMVKGVAVGPSGEKTLVSTRTPLGTGLVAPVTGIESPGQIVSRKTQTRAEALYIAYQNWKAGDNKPIFFDLNGKKAMVRPSKNPIVEYTEEATSAEKKTLLNVGGIPGQQLFSSTGQPAPFFISPKGTVVKSTVREGGGIIPREYAPLGTQFARPGTIVQDYEKAGTKAVREISDEKKIAEVMAMTDADRAAAGYRFVSGGFYTGQEIKEMREQTFSFTPEEIAQLKEEEKKQLTATKEALKASPEELMRNLFNTSPEDIKSRLEAKKAGITPRVLTVPHEDVTWIDTDKGPKKVVSFGTHVEQKGEKISYFEQPSGLILQPPLAIGSKPVPPAQLGPLGVMSSGYYDALTQRERIGGMDVQARIDAGLELSPEMESHYLQMRETAKKTYFDRAKDLSNIKYYPGQLTMDYREEIKKQTGKKNWDDVTDKEIKAWAVGKADVYVGTMEMVYLKGLRIVPKFVPVIGGYRWGGVQKVNPKIIARQKVEDQQDVLNQKLKDKYGQDWKLFGTGSKFKNDPIYIKYKDLQWQRTKLTSSIALGSLEMGIAQDPEKFAVQTAGFIATWEVAGTYLPAIGARLFPGTAKVISGAKTAEQVATGALSAEEIALGIKFAKPAPWQARLGRAAKYTKEGWEATPLPLRVATEATAMTGLFATPSIIGRVGEVSPLTKRPVKFGDIVAEELIKAGVPMIPFVGIKTAPVAFEFIGKATRPLFLRKGPMEWPGGYDPFTLEYGKTVTEGGGGGGLDVGIQPPGGKGSRIKEPSVMDVISDLDQQISGKKKPSVTVTTGGKGESVMDVISNLDQQVSGRGFTGIADINKQYSETLVLKDLKIGTEVMSYGRTGQGAGVVVGKSGWQVLVRIKKTGEIFAFKPQSLRAKPVGPSIGGMEAPLEIIETMYPSDISGALRKWSPGELAERARLDKLKQILDKKASIESNMESLKSQLENKNLPAEQRTELQNQWERLATNRAALKPELANSGLGSGSAKEQLRMLSKEEARLDRRLVGEEAKTEIEKKIDNLVKDRADYEAEQSELRNQMMDMNIPAKERAKAHDRIGVVQKELQKTREALAETRSKVAEEEAAIFQKQLQVKPAEPPRVVPERKAQLEEALRNLESRKKGLRADQKKLNQRFAAENERFIQLEKTSQKRPLTAQEIAEYNRIKKTYNPITNKGENATQRALNENQRKLYNMYNRIAEIEAELSPPRKATVPVERVPAIEKPAEAPTETKAVKDVVENLQRMAYGGAKEKVPLVTKKKPVYTLGADGKWYLKGAEVPAETTTSFEAIFGEPFKPIMEPPGKVSGGAVDLVQVIKTRGWDPITGEWKPLKGVVREEPTWLGKLLGVRPRKDVFNFLPDDISKIYGPAKGSLIGEDFNIKGQEGRGPGRYSVTKQTFIQKKPGRFEARSTYDPAKFMYDAASGGYLDIVLDPRKNPNYLAYFSRQGLEPWALPTRAKTIFGEPTRPEIRLFTENIVEQTNLGLYPPKWQQIAWELSPLKKTPVPMETEIPGITRSVKTVAKHEVGHFLDWFGGKEKILYPIDRYATIIGDLFTGKKSKFTKSYALEASAEITAGRPRIKFPLRSKYVPPEWKPISEPETGFINLFTALKTGEKGQTIFVPGVGEIPIGPGDTRAVTFAEGARLTEGPAKVRVARAKTEIRITRQKPQLTMEERMTDAINQNLGISKEAPKKAKPSIRGYRNLEEVKQLEKFILRPGGKKMALPGRVTRIRVKAPEAKTPPPKVLEQIEIGAITRFPSQDMTIMPGIIPETGQRRFFLGTGGETFGLGKAQTNEMIRLRAKKIAEGFGIPPEKAVGKIPGGPKPARMTIYKARAETRTIGQKLPPKKRLPRPGIFDRPEPASTRWMRGMGKKGQLSMGGMEAPKLETMRAEPPRTVRASKGRTETVLDQRMEAANQASLSAMGDLARSMEFRARATVGPSIVALAPRAKQVSMGASKSMIMQQQVPMMQTISLPKIATAQKPETVQKISQTQKPIKQPLTQIYRPTEPLVPFTPIITPIDWSPPRPPPTTPGGGLLPDGWFGGGRRRRPSKAKLLKARYSPSIIAIEGQIFGPAPQRITGLEVRAVDPRMRKMVEAVARVFRPV